MEILVPIDDVTPIPETVEYAILAYPDASITVLHVLDPGLSTFSTAGMYAYEPMLGARQSDADDLLERATEIADASGTTITTRSVVGEPARKILAVAADRETDHIVLGSCSRTGLDRLLFGSVTARVVREAAVPVTVCQ